MILLAIGHLMMSQIPVENNNTVYDQQDAILGTKDESNSSIFSTIIHGVVAAVITILYRTYFWVVANPIKKVANMYTLMPGNAWHMRLIVNIASVNTPLPDVSNYFTTWLIDKKRFCMVVKMYTASWKVLC